MNAKTLTLGGAVLLVIGLFLPIMSVMGITMNLLMPPGAGITMEGLVLLACALLGGALALLNQTKWAVIAGVVALGWLVWNYLRIQNTLGGGGDIPPEAAEMMAALAPSVNFLGWGVMGLGAVLLLVGGAMAWKSNPPAA